MFIPYARIQYLFIGKYASRQYGIYKVFSGEYYLNHVEKY